MKIDPARLANCPTRLPLQESFIRLKYLEKKFPNVFKRLRSSADQARAFADKEVWPIALDLDQKVHENPEYFDWDITRKGMEAGFLTYMFPTIIGGEGKMLVDLCLMLEELCTACGGVGLIFGAHWLGAGAMVTYFNMDLYFEVFREIVEGKKHGQPVLCAAAVTEPMAGSDVEDRDDIEKARLVSTAKKVDRGYALNGSKVFISDGSVATWIAITAAMDKNRPRETYTGFIVNNKWNGFSVGRWERKMGQKASPAAELILEDVFVPEKYCSGEGRGMEMTTNVLCSSRGPLGAISTGIARGAFERAWLYALDKKEAGQRLIEKQWVQMKLAQMLLRIQQSRQVYMDAAMAMEILTVGMMDQAPDWLVAPARVVTLWWLENTFGKWIMRTRLVNGIVSSLRDKYFRFEGNTERERITAKVMMLASLAKVSGADTAMDVCRLALEIVGQEGPIRDLGLEKCFRDAKLCQIYEGTNQLNRLTMIKYALDLDRLGMK